MTHNDDHGTVTRVGDDMHIDCGDRILVVENWYGDPAYIAVDHAKGWARFEIATTPVYILNALPLIDHATVYAVHTSPSSHRIKRSLLQRKALTRLTRRGFNVTVNRDMVVIAPTRTTANVIGLTFNGAVVEVAS